MADPRLKVEYVPITKLKPAKNPRKNEGSVDAIVRSIEEFGYTNPILARRADGEIIAGHTRVEALKKLGQKTAPVIYLDLDETDAATYRIFDNKSVELAEWDTDMLAEIMRDLGDADVDLALTGFDEDEIVALLAPAYEHEEGEDDVPEVPKKPKTKPGDLWVCGSHRVLCGDATEQKDSARLMQGKLAEMVFTDPPYGVNVTGAGGKAIEGDLTFTLIPFLFDTMIPNVSDGGSIYICGGSSNAPLYCKLFEKYCRRLPHMLVWVKDSFVLRRHLYHSRFELVYFAWKQGAPVRWYGDRSQDDVWEVSRESVPGHPTVKPVGMVAKAVANSSGRGHVVLDPFLGSGSTLIAAEKLERQCYGMEIDPCYCDVIVERWQQYSGGKARRTRK